MNLGGVTYNIWDHVAVVGANLVSSFLNLDPRIFYSTDLSLQPTPRPPMTNRSSFLNIHLFIFVKFDITEFWVSGFI